MTEFTEAHIKVLESIADTLVASLTEEEQAAILNDSHPACAQATDMSSYAEFSGSANVPLIISRMNNFPPHQQQAMHDILDNLATAEGTLKLAGYHKEFTSFSRSERESILLSWKNSVDPAKIAVYKAITSICLNTIYRHLNCPAYPAMGYEGCDPVRNSPNYQPTHPTERLPMMTLEELTRIQKFDVIIIGSGAGGGVCAAQLAAADQSVLVIEKGRYYHEREYQLTEEHGITTLLDSGEPLLNKSGNVQMLFASTFGGSTTVNWSASLKPSQHTRKKWAKDFGLPYFLSTQFTTDLNHVYNRIGASTSGIKHNKSNQYLLEGCIKTGFPVCEVPQNTSGRSHECNWCFYGCKDGVKNGTMNTWLRDAHDCGAKFIDRSEVTRVLIQDNRAVGVECTIQGESKVNIYADRIVVSAGSMRTPGLLINSGLTNKHIGRNLHIHPSTLVFGVFDKPINMHQGSIITAVADVADGVKLEVPNVHAGALYGLLPWRGSLHHKQLVLKYRYFMPLITLTSDRESSGYVTTDKCGQVTFDYTLHRSDHERILKAVDSAIQVLCSVGAREIHTMQLGINPFIFYKDEEANINNPRLKQWRARVRQHGLTGDGVTTYLSAHPMSSCRLGLSPEISATKPSGETWEVKNLYVADASLLPSSAGVNPMVTIEAVALHVSSNIIKAAKSDAHL
ncbi:GMC oxidoreductase-domain-containing protein [Fennellomyces sp. T-0311]|nr:GMC oxidoreductase-domain-containing protein [Fennellomyces sp. T-0311]